MFGYAKHWSVPRRPGPRSRRVLGGDPYHVPALEKVMTVDNGLAAFDRDPHLAAGLNVRDGRIMHSAVAASLGFDKLDSGKARSVAA